MGFSFLAVDLLELSVQTLWFIDTVCVYFSLRVRSTVSGNGKNWYPSLPVLVHDSFWLHMLSLPAISVCWWTRSLTHRYTDTTRHKTQIDTHARAHTHTETRAHACSHTHVRTHGRTHTHIQRRARAHARTHTHTHTHSRTRTHSITHACIHACTYERTRVHTDTLNRTWIHARTHIHTHAHTKSLMHTHTHTHTHTHSLCGAATCLLLSACVLWLMIDGG